MRVTHCDFCHLSQGMIPAAPYTGTGPSAAHTVLGSHGLPPHRSPGSRQPSLSTDAVVPLRS